MRTKCPYCNAKLELIKIGDKAPEPAEPPKPPKEKKPKKKKQKESKDRYCSFKFGDNARCANKALEGSEYCKAHQS